MTAQAMGNPKERVVEALMALAAELPWDDIELGAIAERAGVSLGELRDITPSKGAILGLFSRMIDRKVLDGYASGLSDEPAKDRIFDVLMRRLDMMAPYRPAMRVIVPALRRDPLALSAMNGVVLNSMRYMLAAAEVSTEDSLGGLKLQGLAIAWARIVDSWLEDEDPGLAKTMAALDRALDRGGKLIARAQDVHRLTAPLRAFAESLMDGGRRFRERSRERAERGRPAPDDEVVSV